MRHKGFGDGNGTDPLLVIGNARHSPSSAPLSHSKTYFNVTKESSHRIVFLFFHLGKYYRYPASEIRWVFP